MSEPGVSPGPETRAKSGVEEGTLKVAGSPSSGPPFIVKNTLLEVWVRHSGVSAFSKTRSSLHLLNWPNKCAFSYTM